MKRGIELNGVANLRLLVEALTSEHVPVKTQYEADIIGQLDLLERYMLAYMDAVNKGIKEPCWHEIKANPAAYPTNRERR